MKMSELMEGGKVRKGMSLDVRVPANLKKKVGKDAVNGELVSVRRAGKAVQVKVKVGEKSFTFRPQDLTPAAAG